MINVVITGIPKSIKYLKFASFLKKSILKTERDIHVNYIKPILNTGLKKLSIWLRPNEAHKAKRLLNGYPFIYAQKEFILSCRLENVEDDESYHEIEERQSRNFRYVEDYEPPQKSRRFTNSPARAADSHSSYHSNELKEIELKIQLIKKQRTLMEEETKLLLEKKKLECLQNFGSNDYANLTNLEKKFKCNNVNEISEFVGAPQSSQMAEKKPIQSARLPSFLGPCKEIIAQMHSSINSHGGITSENRSLLFNLLRSTLKKRLTVVLEGKTYMPTKKIVSLYRANYHQTTDTNLLDELCNTISTSCWPRKKNKVKKIIPEIKNEGQNEGAANPTDAQEVKVKESEENSFIEARQLDDFVQYVDMENDVENWVIDEDVTNLDEEFNVNADTVIQMKGTGENDSESRNQVKEAVEEQTYEVEKKNVDDLDDKNKNDDVVYVVDDEAKDIEGLKHDDAKDVKDFKHDKAKDVEDLKHDDAKDVEDFKHDEAKDVEGLKHDDAKDVEDFKHDEAKDIEGLKQDDAKDIEDLKHDDAKDIEDLKHDDAKDIEDLKHDEAKVVDLKDDEAEVANCENANIQVESSKNDADVDDGNESKLIDDVDKSNQESFVVEGVQTKQQ